MQFNPHNQRQERQRVFMGAAEGFANLMAVLAVFFMTPALYNHTAHLVADFTRKYYGTDIAMFVDFAWLFVCGLIIFFVARMTVTTAIVAGALTLAVRYI